MYFLLMFKLSFHLMRGEKKKANMFVVKVPSRTLNKGLEEEEVSMYGWLLRVVSFFFLFFPSLPPPTPWLSETCKLRSFIAALPNASLELRV